MKKVLLVAFAVLLFAAPAYPQQCTPGEYTLYCGRQCVYGNPTRCDGQVPLPAYCLQYNPSPGVPTCHEGEYDPCCDILGLF